MAIDSTLLSILACPQDKGPLLLVGDELLYNPRLRRAYPIENGIPGSADRRSARCGGRRAREVARAG